MTHAEKVLSETSGEVEFNAAKKEQKVMCRLKSKKKSNVCMILSITRRIDFVVIFTFSIHIYSIFFGSAVPT